MRRYSSHLINYFFIGLLWTLCYTREGTGFKTRVLLLNSDNINQLPQILCRQKKRGECARAGIEPTTFYGARHADAQTIMPQAPTYTTAYLCFLRPGICWVAVYCCPSSVATLWAGKSCIGPTFLH